MPVGCSDAVRVPQRGCRQAHGRIVAPWPRSPLRIARDLRTQVTKLDDCIGDDVSKAVASAINGSVRAAAVPTVRGARARCPPPAPAAARPLSSQPAAPDTLPSVVPCLPQLLLLENVRFYPEEEKNDPEFAKKVGGGAPAGTHTCDKLFVVLRAQSSLHWRMSCPPRGRHAPPDRRPAAGALALLSGPGTHRCCRPRLPAPSRNSWPPTPTST